MSLLIPNNSFHLTQKARFRFNFQLAAFGLDQLGFTSNASNAFE